MAYQIRNKKERLFYFILFSTKKSVFFFLFSQKKEKKDGTLLGDMACPLLFFRIVFFSLLLVFYL